ncbi:hypothetical protein B0H19DRAFT_1237168 [Mycena capillaripes]|nr:hypothetical protein B0H19DRAFT_1237168 [Mycena capillaripes]
MAKNNRNTICFGFRPRSVPPLDQPVHARSRNNWPCDKAAGKYGVLPYVVNSERDDAIGEAAKTTAWVRRSSEFQATRSQAARSRSTSQRVLGQPNWPYLNRSGESELLRTRSNMKVTPFMHQAPELFIFVQRAQIIPAICILSTGGLDEFYSDVPGPARPGYPGLGLA